MKNIDKKFEKINTIEFSQAIQIEDKEIYLVYKVNINSLNLDKNKTNLINSINGEYTPIAYLYKENDEIYINHLNANYIDYLKNKKNIKEIITKFKEKVVG